MKTKDIKLKKPTMFQIIFGALISLFKNEQIKKEVPKIIGEYRLISEIEKDNDFRRFAVGIYKNEINIPPVIDAIIEKTRTSIVFKHIDGEKLETFPINYQAEVIFNCYSFLDKLSNELTRGEKKIFIRRSPWFYIFSLPVIWALLAIKHPSTFLKISRSFFQALPFAIHLFREKLIITHRDLSPENILIKDGIIFIIDFEQAVLTNKYYDQMYIFTEPRFAELKNELTKKSILRKDAFLWVYMVAHFALDSANSQELFQYYISIL